MSSVAFSDFKHRPLPRRSTGSGESGAATAGPHKFNSAGDVGLNLITYPAQTSQTIALEVANAVAAHAQDPTDAGEAHRIFPVHAVTHAQHLLLQMGQLPQEAAQIAFEAILFHLIAGQITIAGEQLQQFGVVASPPSSPGLQAGGRHIGS